MRKLFRWTLRAILLLFLAIGAAWFFENYRGKKAWEEAQARADKLGVSLDLADYAAPTIPDSEKLLKNPVFAREWSGEIEPRLGRWTEMELEGVKSRGVRHQRGEAMDYLQFFPDETDPKIAIEKLFIATRSAESRLNQLAEAILANPPRDLTTRQLSLLDATDTSDEILTLKKIANSFENQALLALHRNESQIAVRNVQVIDRLAQNFARPDLLHLLVSNAVHSLNHRIIQEGIILQSWKNEDLDSLAKLLQTEVNRKEMLDTLSFEAAFVIPLIKDSKALQEKISESFGELFGTQSSEPPTLKDKLQNWIHYDGPAGWGKRREAFVLNSLLDLIESRPAWEWKQGERVSVNLDEPEEDTFSFDPLALYRNQNQAYTGSVRAMFEHALRNRAFHLAIEVEKFRLTTGAFPKDLNELGLSTPITDPCDPHKRPLHFEQRPSGGFQVYSVFFYNDEPDPRRNRFIWLFPGKE